MLSALSPILVFADRLLDSIETRVVAPLAARFYQLVPHCSGCGGPVPYDALDCEGCRTLDAFELRRAWTRSSFRQSVNRARRPTPARTVQYLPMAPLAPNDAAEDGEADTLQSA